MEGDRLPSRPRRAHGLVDVEVVPLPDLSLNFAHTVLVTSDARAERGQEDVEPQSQEVQNVEGHRQRNDEDHEDPEEI